MSKTTVIISDTQIPYHHRKSTDAVIKFIGEYKPDEVVHIGDLMDYPTVGRWSKGKAPEYQGSVFADSQRAKDLFLTPLRAVYDGPVGVLEGNHDLRPRQYLAEYAPALAESGAFNFSVMLDFDGYGITQLPDFYPIAPGWIATHGHLGGIRLTQKSGQTALNAALRFHESVVMGHTHRLGLMGQSFGYDGNVQTIWGLEVGNLMDMKQAQYLKRATANWQQGFGILHQDGTHVRPEAVSISDGKFVVDGNVYFV